MSASRKKDSAARRHRAQTFSGLPTETLEFLSVPTTDGPDDISSNGEGSSPESAPEQKVEPKIIKKQKKGKKKERLLRDQNKHKQAPPSPLMADFFTPTLLTPEMLKETKRSSSDDSAKVPNKNSLSTPKIEKSQSFKKKSKPDYLEKTIKEALENKEHKRSHSRSESRSSDKGLSEYNIVLLGDLGVGKTALAVRFVTRRYLHEYDPALERSYEKMVTCNDEQVNVRLVDTVNRNWDNFVDQADGFLILYSVTSSQSATNARNQVDSIRSSSNTHIKNTPILLLGNKCELELARRVTRDEMIPFASQHNVAFKEVSVACTISVDSIIKTLVKAIQKQQGGRATHINDKLNVSHSQSGISRKPSNAKYKMKNLLSKKKEKV